MEIGDKIPSELGIDEFGNVRHYSEFSGMPLIVYFYPKDMTSGCTAQACSIRDHYKAIKALGYEVLGVSVDSGARHQKFIEKNELPFSLIADTEHSLVEAFGVWAEKKMYGKAYMGIVRTTFIFDAEGTLVNKLSGKAVKTKEHAEQILNLIS